MKTASNKNKTIYKNGSQLIWNCILALMIMASSSCGSIAKAESSESATQSNTEAKVTGLRYNNVHVLQLEKTLKLYIEILGFELVDAEVLKGALAGMLVLKVKRFE